MIFLAPPSSSSCICIHFPFSPLNNSKCIPWILCIDKSRLTNWSINPLVRVTFTFFFAVLKCACHSSFEKITLQSHKAKEKDMHVWHDTDEVSRPWVFETRISLSLGRHHYDFFRTIPKSCIKAGGKSSQTKRHFLNGIGWSTRGRSDCQNIYCVDAITSMSFPAWLKSFTAVEYTIFIIKFSFTLTSYAFTASFFTSPAAAESYRL